ncbi:MAG: hypothetical protein HQL45_08315 [Alphaproteobacteria bacterium]|jgi:hypothetical protein|nr:hypothetical protein [Alphaproteobacteria bacterium]MBF0355683.1 hypothetical protein [Alphaproteobacteria bacterium]
MSEIAMTKTNPGPRRLPNKWVVFALMILFSVGMFASIMYKVAKYGP